MSFVPRIFAHPASYEHIHRRPPRSLDHCCSFFKRSVCRGRSRALPCCLGAVVADRAVHTEDVYSAHSRHLRSWTRRLFCCCIRCDPLVCSVGCPTELELGFGPV